MNTQPTRVLPSRTLALVSGVLLSILGLMVLSGWAFDVSALKSVFPGLGAMRANTAESLFLSGVALALLSLENRSKQIRWLVLVLGTIVFVIGSLTLVEHLSGWRLGIDQILFGREAVELSNPNPGRMSPTAALGLVIAGMALILASLRASSQWRHSARSGSALGLSMIVFGAMAVSTNLLNTTLHFHLWAYTRVGAHTGFGFVLLGAGLLAVVRAEGGLKWSMESPTTAGMLIGIASLLAVAIISDNFTYRLQQDDLLVGHSQEVLKEIAAIAGDMASLESGQRGFIILGDDQLLNAREKTEAAIQANLSKVRGLTVDNLDQQRRLDLLEPMIAERNDWGDKTITARRKSGFGAAQALLAFGTGIRLSNKITGTLNAMRDEEYALLDVHRRKSEITTTATFLLLPLGLFLSLTTVSLAISFLNAGVNDRLEAERALRSTNEHLRSTEDRFRLLISGVKDYAIFLLDTDGRVATWNPGAKILKGWEADEIIGQHFSRFYSSTEIENGKPQRELEIAKAEGRYEEEGWRVRKDGSRFWAHVLITAVRDDQGQLTGFAKVTRDLTDPRLKEQTIKEEEERLAAVIGSAMDAVITVDENQIITLFNPAAERIFLCSADEAIGKSLDRFIPDRYRGKHLSHLRNFGQTNTTRRRMGELSSIYGLRSSGEEFPIEASISQAQIGQHRVFSVILRDITQRKHAEEEMRRQASLLDLAPVLVRDIDNRIVYWSSGLERIYGYSREEAIGTISHDLLKTDFPVPLEQIEQSLMNEGGWEGELVHLAKDGSRVVVASQWVFCIATQKGTPIRILEVNADVTARKKAEQAHLRSQKLEGLGTLAGGIAHDFNNILLAINGNAKLAAEDLAAGHPALESVNEISKAGARAADLVRRILAFSRPQELKREVIQMQPVVEEALKLVRATLPATIEFRTQFAEKLPAVLADATQIHQIVVNLATNAAHAIGPKPGLIEFRLDLIKLNDEYPALSPGIKGGQLRYFARQRQWVWDESCYSGPNLRSILYYKKARRGHRGNLGLAVVHGIVTNYGGSVRVYSEPGKGTVFHLYFPATESVAETETKKTFKVQRGQNEHILYVDDEEELVLLGTRMLQRLGYKVTGYTDAARALEDFRIQTTRLRRSCNRYVDARNVRSRSCPGIIRSTSGYPDYRDFGVRAPGRSRKSTKHGTSRFDPEAPRHGPTRSNPRPGNS